MKELEKICAELKAAERVLASASEEDKNHALEAIADALERDSDAILAANKLDTDAFAASGGSASMLDRLTLTAERIRGIADGVRSVASLDDPVGEVMGSFEAADGLDRRAHV